MEALGVVGPAAFCHFYHLLATLDAPPRSEEATPFCPATIVFAVRAWSSPDPHAGLDIRQLVDHHAVEAPAAQRIGIVGAEEPDAGAVWQRDCQFTFVDGRAGNGVGWPP